MAPANDTSFAPDRAATRYEVIEALYELLDFTNLEDTNLFTDVDEAHRAMVNAFAQTPIIDGYPDGTFGRCKQYHAGGVCQSAQRSGKGGH